MLMYAKLIMCIVTFNQINLRECIVLRTNTDVYSRIYLYMLDLLVRVFQAVERVQGMQKCPPSNGLTPGSGTLDESSRRWRHNT